MLYVSWLIIMTPSLPPRDNFCYLLELSPLKQGYAKHTYPRMRECRWDLSQWHISSQALPQEDARVCSELSFRQITASLSCKTSTVKG